MLLAFLFVRVLCPFFTCSFFISFYPFPVQEDKLGIRASSTCELVLEGCRVPKEAVLGEVWGEDGENVRLETANFIIRHSSLCSP